MIRFVIYFTLCALIHSHYTLYHSNGIHMFYPTYDCLYAHWISETDEINQDKIENDYLVPYCRRPDNDDDDADTDQDLIDLSNENIAKRISFLNLKKLGVTSEQLLISFAPVDIAERYAMNDNDLEFFYNCSSPWFGSRCQYTFGHDLSLPFTDIVQKTIRAKLNHFETNNIITTCYRFLSSCNDKSMPLCLDWREICDGKFDCLSGEDEQWCEMLDTTRCDADHYRCHYGGQCIPSEFFRDGQNSVDCLDGSDESDHSAARRGKITHGCHFEQVQFACEERIGRFLRSFSCGNDMHFINLTIPSDLFYCPNGRDKMMTSAVLTSLIHISNINCQQAFRCTLFFNQSYGADLSHMESCHQFIVENELNNHTSLLNKHCSMEWLSLSEQPILFGFFHFVYLTNRSNEEFEENLAPDFVCFDLKKCPAPVSDTVFINIMSTLNCCRTSDLTQMEKIKNFRRIIDIFRDIAEKCLRIGSELTCRNPLYFHCNRSLKCIPYHRVSDGNYDCYYGEDEFVSMCHLNDSTRFRCLSDKSKCLSRVALGDVVDSCPCQEDETYDVLDNSRALPFPLICDGTTRMFRYDNETWISDERSCEFWPCDNVYTHCDGKWHCLNGMDELNCIKSECPLNHFRCWSSATNTENCLPITNFFVKCHKRMSFESISHYYINETSNLSGEYYAMNNFTCITEEIICNNHSQMLSMLDDVCTRPSIEYGMFEFMKVIPGNDYISCFNKGMSKQTSSFPTASGLGYFPSTKLTVSSTYTMKRNQEDKRLTQLNILLDSYCHEGILVHFGINRTKTCLCSPSYYGARCQWQSQHISLTLRFILDSSISVTSIFEVIIMLIDEQGEITPYHDRILFLPSHHCNRKFNIYLLYHHRPKYVSVNYSIRIIMFDKISLQSKAHWYLPIQFPFLPVIRIATLLNISHISDTLLCSLSCGEHGICKQYRNNRSLFFCECQQEYSGLECQIKRPCHCSNESFCLSSSICICPLHKFGPYCYLNYSICNSNDNPCKHNGLCIPGDDRLDIKTFICICKEGYFGERCEIAQSLIHIQIHNKIPLINSMVFLHFITMYNRTAEPDKSIIFKKIPYDQQVLTVYAPLPFNLLFVQFPDNDYYLSIVKEVPLLSEYINSQISLEQRCPRISELLNTSVLHKDPLYYIKLYPRLCQLNRELMCFYDELYMCVCDLQRFSRCFSFNHKTIHDCQGNNDCLNDARCFQKIEGCTTTSACLCGDCYYGVKCQFSTSNFILSLDPILGYHIRPNVAITDQPTIVKVSIVIVVLISILGLISEICSIATFYTKILREVGCGYYLIVSSIGSMFMIMMLIIKFVQLFLSQMETITNRSLLTVSCKLLDFTLITLLAFIEWLNACVSSERMTNVIKGITFNKGKSKKYSKRIICIIFILIILSYIHDPIHRQLIDDIDIDYKRTWCFPQYPLSITTYNSFITIFHFLIPFTINLISAIVIIICVARNRSHVEPKVLFKQHLKQQLHQHRHLLITSCLLILLSLPRLVISFTTRCMKSAREPWLYLIGYFVSFIPSMLTFIVYILPSKTYKKEFNRVVQLTIARFRSNP